MKDKLMALKGDPPQGDIAFAGSNDPRSENTKTWQCYICKSRFVIGANEKIPPCPVCGNGHETKQKPPHYSVDI
jgi:rubrerythrin